jgi:hypothetical protein
MIDSSARVLQQCTHWHAFFYAEAQIHKSTLTQSCRSSGCERRLTLEDGIYLEQGPDVRFGRKDTFQIASGDSCSARAVHSLRHRAHALDGKPEQGHKSLLSFATRAGYKSTNQKRVPSAGRQRGRPH